VIASFRPDLIVLDLMLPRMNGIEVCRKLRTQGNFVPIIIVSALQDLSDKIAGLDNGADDYMTKPFSPQELISRIQAILRRTMMIPGYIEEDVLTIGALALHPHQREVTHHGQVIELTPKEFDLLLFMMKHPGKVLSRQHLLHGVWDYHFLGDTRIVDVHMSHLRDKIEVNARNPEYIITVRNIGYKLCEPVVKNNAIGVSSGNPS
jgi:two-component system alkaline phosphatase synthesis response regulator PhoP